MGMMEVGPLPPRPSPPAPLRRGHLTLSVTFDLPSASDLFTQSRCLLDAEPSSKQMAKTLAIYFQVYVSSFIFVRFYAYLVFFFFFETPSSHHTIPINNGSRRSSPRIDLSAVNEQSLQ